MKSGSWSSYVAAGATGPHEPDDDWPPVKTVPDPIVPGQRFMKAGPRCNWDVYDWDGIVCDCVRVRNAGEFPLADPSCPTCKGEGYSGCQPCDEPAAADLCEADARLLTFGGQLLTVLKEVLPEIDRKEFVAGCVDDLVSPELRRLWRLSKKVRDAIAMAEGA